MFPLHKWVWSVCWNCLKLNIPVLNIQYFSSVWLWESRSSALFIFHCSSGLTLEQKNLLTFCWLTVEMLVGQPVVFGILKLKVGVAELALLGSVIFEVLGAVVSVAKLILVVYSWAVLATVGGSGERKMDKHQRSWSDSVQFFGAYKTNIARKVMLKCQETYMKD